jgi:lipopolysaccharide/colanic/teichoic acid biosynthesis glycosyltransferase
MRQLRYAILIADMVWISIAVFLAHRIQFGFWYDLSATGSRRVHPDVLIIMLLLWAAIYSLMKLDGFREGWNVPSMSSRVAVGTFVYLSSLASVCFLQKQCYSRTFVLEFSALLLVGLIALRIGFRWLFVLLGRTRVSRRVVILGNGRIVSEVAEKISHHPEMMWNVVGLLYPPDAKGGLSLAGTVGSNTTTHTLEVLEILHKSSVQELIVILPQLGTEGHKLIKACQQSGISIRIVPHSYELYVSKVKLQEIGGLPLLSLQGRDPRLAALVVKRALDVTLSSALLIILCPFLMLTIIVLRASSHKALRVECRCGKDGQPFRMYRLNVDRHDPQQKNFHGLLVQLSLTELPQLFNVLRGQMSMVGPRPESPERVKHYSDWQRQRLEVKPGITGLAQVRGLREQHSSETKATFDMQYILNWSPFGDIALILQTVWTLATRPYAGKQVSPFENIDSHRNWAVAPREEADASRA